MGISVEGVLFWGIWYNPSEEFLSLKGILERAFDVEHESGDKECPPPEEDYSLWEERRNPAYAALWADWRTRRREWKARQGCCDYAGHPDHIETIYVAIAGSKREAEWDHMEPIASLASDPDWEPKLREYVKALGLPWKTPGWYLTSRYSH